jgi:hypothetical protein
MTTLQLIGRIIVLACIIVMIVLKLLEAKNLYELRIWKKNQYLRLIEEGDELAALYVYRHYDPKPDIMYANTTYWTVLWEVLVATFKQDDEYNYFDFYEKEDTEETSYRYIRDKYEKDKIRCG